MATIFKSIRWTLQLWHAVLLLLVVCIFAATMYFTLRHTRMQRVDTELRAMADVLAAEMHPMQLRRFNHEHNAQTRPAHGEEAPAGLPGRGPAEGDRPEIPNAERSGGEETPHGALPRENAHPNHPVLTSAAMREAFEGRFNLRDDVLRQYETGAARAPYFAIWRTDGELLQSSLAGDKIPPPPPAGMFPLTTSAAVVTPSQPYFRQRGEYREAMVAGPFGMPVLVGRSIAREEAEQRTLLELLAITSAGVLALGLIGGWLLSRRAVAPILNITATAQSISASNLSRRINIHETESELGMMATVLNATFDRLQAAFEQQVRFTADASHELRTPLSVIYSHAELGLSKPRTAEKYRQIIETCLRASKRMKSLVDALLVLARADSGKLQVKREPFDLAAVVRDSVELLRPLATEKNITFDLNLCSARASGDAFLFGQAVTNLLTNAIKYNRIGGKVAASVEAAGEQARLVISDTGPGISAEDQGHLFERFYRGDKSRMRESKSSARGAAPSGEMPHATDQSGTGLGLAICESIVAAHKGSISVSSKLNQGTTFTIALPLLASAAPSVASSPVLASPSPVSTL